MLINPEAMARLTPGGFIEHNAGNVRYAVIENGIVVNEILAGEDPTGLTHHDGQTLVRLPDPHDIDRGWKYNESTGEFSPPDK